MYFTSHLFIGNVLLYNNYNSCNLSSSQWLTCQPKKKLFSVYNFMEPGSGNIRSDYGNQTIQTPDANNGQLTLLKNDF